MDHNSEEAGWREFLQLCLHVDDVTTLDKLLRLHLTQEEQEAIAMRCLIVRELLKEEKTQRVIAQALQVSIAKITRGSNSLKLVDPDLRAYLLAQIKS
ncbi:MAG TPA: trp operon repressor [Gammaproteobacteria bacterium]|nr:trp operon repressor [Gammaproteobacteria bacterium]